MEVSRRSFLGALASAPLGRVLAGPPSAPWLDCALPESRAGFARALAGRDTTGVLALPGAAGWDASIAARVRAGHFVIFESASGFTEARAFDEQRVGLRAAFALTIEPPVRLWSEGGRPSYLDLTWPVRARVRDFSLAVPVRGGETMGTIAGRPVAALQRAGAGALLFLGSPVGPALWSCDPQAHAWLGSVLATARGPR